MARLSDSTMRIKLNDGRLVVGDKTFNPALIAGAEYNDGALTVYFMDGDGLTVRGDGAALAWELMTCDRIDLADGAP